MTAPSLRWLGLVIFPLCLTSHAATLANFGFAGGSLLNSATPIPGITISSIASGSTFLTFTSATGWDSAAQISGASSFFSPATQANAANAVYFSVAAADGYTFSIEGFSFLARSTGMAPTDIGFKIGSTSYDFSETHSNNSTITSISNSSLGLTNLTTAIISVQGWNASGSSALQLDNIQLLGTVIPEPSSMILGILSALVLLRRRR
jgi:hypothetical protein